MKSKYSEKIEIPAGIICEVKGKSMICKKGDAVSERKVYSTKIDAKVEGNTIVIECKAGNKREYKTIKSCIAHLKGIFKGLNEHYVYKLEACNVHFPMSLKVEPGHLIINNFLGEKLPRKAIILPHVKVEVKGQLITVSSHDKESAGQTAANLERATKVQYKDRRVFQDGIYITNKPGEKD